MKCINCSIDMEYFKGISYKGNKKIEYLAYKCPVCGIEASTQEQFKNIKIKDISEEYNDDL